MYLPKRADRSISSFFSPQFQVVLLLVSGFALAQSQFVPFVRFLIQVFLPFLVSFLVFSLAFHLSFRFAVTHRSQCTVHAILRLMVGLREHDGLLPFYYQNLGYKYCFGVGILSSVNMSHLVKTSAMTSPRAQLSRSGASGEGFILLVGLLSRLSTLVLLIHTSSIPYVFQSLLL